MALTKLNFQCSCGGKLAGVEVGESATIVVKRTCRRCGSLWQVVASPMKVTATAKPPQGRFIKAMHKGELTCLRGGKSRKAKAPYRNLEHDPNLRGL